MRMLLVIGLALSVALYGLYAYLTVDRRGDEERIRSLIENAVHALNERDLGGAMRNVSENYRDSENLNRDRLRMLAAQALRSERPFAVYADVGELSVFDDSATVKVTATVKDAVGRSIYNRDLELTLKREDARHAGLLPAKLWRVVNIQNLGIGDQF